jgi:hypothetical protein
MATTLFYDLNLPDYATQSHENPLPHMPGSFPAQEATSTSNIPPPPPAPLREVYRLRALTRAWKRLPEKAKSKLSWATHWALQIDDSPKIFELQIDWAHLSASWEHDYWDKVKRRVPRRHLGQTRLTDEEILKIG